MRGRRGLLNRLGKCREVVCPLRRENMDDEKNRFGGRARIGYLHLRPLWRRYHWQIIAIVIAVFILFSLLSPQLPSLPAKTEPGGCQSTRSNNWNVWHSTM